jgi:hypothetical protein
MGMMNLKTSSLRPSTKHRVGKVMSVYLPQFSEQDSDIKTTKSFSSSSHENLAQRTACLTVVANCAKFSVATLTETFYHVPFTKYPPTIITTFRHSSIIYSSVWLKL